MTPNMKATLDALRADGFIVGYAPLDCGHVPTPTDYSIGYAVTLDDRNICYACADAMTREDMRTADRIVLYLVGQTVQTWSGGVVGHVTSRVTRKMRSPGTWAWHDRAFVRVTDLDGKQWHGSGPGEGMYINLRATRPLTQKRATRARK